MRELLTEEAHFVAGGRRTALVLPFELDRVLTDWASLRGLMARSKPETFSRSEWAYLIEFVDRTALERVFVETFGDRTSPGSPADVVLAPGGDVGVWLPNNVSLLGALTLVLLSLTGNRVRIKAGSRGSDLTEEFHRYAVANLPAGPLRDHLTERVSIEAFSRSDSRNAAWAASCRYRLAFGSDEAVAAIHALEHPAVSTGFSFGHRVSEAWLEPAACDDPALAMLLKVFDVYGQAACTSPRRVVLLDASLEDARRLRERLAALWGQIFPRRPEMALASEAILDRQWSAALGWDSRLVALNGAAISVGSDALPVPAGHRLLSIVPMSVANAIANLPPNIQTVGHILSSERNADLAPRLSGRVLRFVPVADMHRFGPVWDGQPFWRETFSGVDAP